MSEVKVLRNLDKNDSDRALHPMIDKEPYQDLVPKSNLKERVEELIKTSKNVDEILIIEFFENDFRGKNSEKDLILALKPLQSFEKINFLLKETQKYEKKSHFIGLAANFLRTATNLKYFEISGSGSFNVEEEFTLQQLYAIVQPNYEKSEPIAEILISTQALPECLRKKIGVDDRLNLLKITEDIIEEYTIQIFNKTIEGIQNSVNSREGIFVQFEDPLEKLTDAQTQTLAKALETKGCKIFSLKLPLCNLNFLTDVIVQHSTLQQLHLFDLPASDATLNGLMQVVAKSSTIQRIKCDYRLFLEPNFYKIIDQINESPQSKIIKLTEKNTQEFKYIELTDNSGKTYLGLKTLYKLVIAIESLSSKLTHIQVVVALSKLDSELLATLANNDLIFHSADHRGYEIEEINQRNAPLLGPGQKCCKFIFSPCYNSQQRVIQQIRLYLERQLKKQQEKGDTDLKGSDSEVKILGDSQPTIVTAEIDGNQRKYNAKSPGYSKNYSKKIKEENILKFKVAQYGLYAIAMLALITSIVVGLLVTLPYVSIPIAITLLALVTSEAARRQKNNFERNEKEKIDIGTEDIDFSRDITENVTENVKADIFQTDRSVFTINRRNYSDSSLAEIDFKPTGNFFK